MIWLLKSVIKYFLRSFISSFTTIQQPKPKKGKIRKQGEVHVSKQPPRDKKIRENVGEYIDYEEIK
ncbi:MAG: DUF4834 family protein [Prevotellaceae bacterium]|nr:DUF4834 family protein [Prevotellaceae bacterium]